jgi:hypothetical protein
LPPPGINSRNPNRNHDLYGTENQALVGVEVVHLGRNTLQEITPRGEELAVQPGEPLPYCRQEHPVPPGAESVGNRRIAPCSGRCGRPLTRTGTPSRNLQTLSHAPCPRLQAAMIHRHGWYRAIGRAAGRWKYGNASSEGCCGPPSPSDLEHANGMRPSATHPRSPGRYRSHFFEQGLCSRAMALISWAATQHQNAGW